MKFLEPNSELENMTTIGLSLDFHLMNVNLKSHIAWFKAHRGLVLSCMDNLTSFPLYGGTLTKQRKLRHLSSYAKMRPCVKFQLLSQLQNWKIIEKNTFSPFSLEQTIDKGSVSTETKWSQIPNHIQTPSQPNFSTSMPSSPCSTLSQLYVKQGIRSFYFIITLCLWSGLEMKNAHYRAQACRALLNSKYISEIH